MPLPILRSPHSIQRNMRIEYASNGGYKQRVSNPLVAVPVFCQPVSFATPSTQRERTEPCKFGKKWSKTQDPSQLNWLNDLKNQQHDVARSFFSAMGRGSVQLPTVNWRICRGFYCLKNRSVGSEQAKPSQPIFFGSRCRQKAERLLPLCRIGLLQKVSKKPTLEISLYMILAMICLNHLESIWYFILCFVCVFPCWGTGENLSGPYSSSSTLGTRWNRLVARQSAPVGLLAVCLAEALVPVLPFFHIFSMCLLSFKHMSENLPNNSCELFAYNIIHA